MRPLKDKVNHEELTHELMNELGLNEQELAMFSAFALFRTVSNSVLAELGQDYVSKLDRTPITVFNRLEENGSSLTMQDPAGTGYTVFQIAPEMRARLLESMSRESLKLRVESLLFYFDELVQSTDHNHDTTRLDAVRDLSYVAYLRVLNERIGLSERMKENVSNSQLVADAERFMTDPLSPPHKELTHYIAKDLRGGFPNEITAE